MLWAMETFISTLQRFCELVIILHCTYVGTEAQDRFRLIPHFRLSKCSNLELNRNLFTNKTYLVSLLFATF